MDIEKNGELENTSPEDVFAAVYRGRAYGIVHFKGPESEAVFVAFERGLAQHASGGGLDGEAAIKAVLSWREGEYRFIDDIRPDDEDFPPNVPGEVAESLGAGAAEAPSTEAAVENPPLPVLPAGEADAKVVVPKTADELFKELAESRFTGCCAVGPARSRRGLFVFATGESRGGLLWDGESMRRGDDARSVLKGDFGRFRDDLDFFNLDEETAGILALGLTASIAIARIPAAALNIEEYLAWVKKDRGTVLVSIIAGRGSANILIKSGETLGAVITPSTEVSGERDEALALYYSPEATLEVFAEVKRTP